VDVAGPQGAALRITELVEDEQRVIAGAAEVAVVGAALLLAVSRTDARIHIEHDHLHGPAGMHGVDPAPGEISERGQVRVEGQHLGLEAAHLAGGCGLPGDSPTTDDPAHGRIVGQAFGIVHVLVAGQSTEHGLAELAQQGMSPVRARAGVR
jgi:hypothetical protein